MVGTTISHYKVLEEIGQGGIHTVKVPDLDIASDRTLYCVMESWKDVS
ncbi:MAG: hypothetical protein IH917_10760 [Acidobacteria bacterium]|nr:hypothetical protein [Acidobacteriota bacterium]